MAAHLARSLTTGLVIFLLLALQQAGEARSAELPLQADRILILKSERKLLLLHEGALLKSFWIALGPHPEGPKTAQGDGRTPEGTYRIDGRNDRTHFHKSLHISYPNKADRQRARDLGIDPGGAIRIHGVPRGYGPTGPGERMIDWTDGCIAVTNADIDEIWARVPTGTIVEIRP
ncbi:MAG TPA: L,D-transpeptidase family protein [Alphaproteobacteria bacterium]|nr:L,D-transpeptidase family protein [Alphaproteobacteria bacterium]